MIGAGIYPGDLVILDRSIEAEPGHIPGQPGDSGRCF